MTQRCLLMILCVSMLIFLLGGGGAADQTRSLPAQPNLVRRVVK